MARSKNTPAKPNDKKETKEEKLRRKEEIKKAQQQAFTVVLPIFVAILFVIFGIFYFKSISVDLPVLEEAPANLE